MSTTEGPFVREVDCASGTAVDRDLEAPELEVAARCALRAQAQQQQDECRAEALLRLREKACDDPFAPVTARHLADLLTVMGVW